MEMTKRRLGRTGWLVTPISLGALPLQRCTLEEAGPVLEAVLEAGINFIDTARAYTDSEEKIGRYLAPRRQEFYLASKSMARDKASMARDIDTSLRLMKTERIDLYQIHNIKARQDLDAVMAPGGALEALEDARQAGKIAHLGVTGHSVPLLIEAVKSDRFATVQVPFNCIERAALDELFPLAASMDVGRIVMKPLGGGQLSRPNLALRYILGQDVSVVIPGMDEVAQVRENTAAALPFVPLAAAEQDELDAEAAAVGKNFCRRCGYCLPCSVGIDIPQLFIFHLQYQRYGLTKAIPERYGALAAKASACTQCGACEPRCPYDIPIRERMRQVAADLG